MKEGASELVFVHMMAGEFCSVCSSLQQETDERKNQPSGGPASAQPEHPALLSSLSNRRATCVFTLEQRLYW